MGDETTSDHLGVLDFRPPFKKNLGESERERARNLQGTEGRVLLQFWLT